MIAPRAVPIPSADEVDVWWIDLARIAHADRFLSPEERHHAERFRQARDRARWVAARAALRQVLGRYTATAPEEIALTRGAWGKPALAGEARLRFSLSHAGERAALAVATAREVGIDLEPLDPDLELGPLLAAACTAAETARIMALPAGERVVGLLTCWTVKEAYLKGNGTGLLRDPRDIAVDVASRADGRAVVRDPVGSTPWAIRLLDPGPGWVAALAVAGAEPAVRERHWPSERRRRPSTAKDTPEH